MDVVTAAIATELAATRAIRDFLIATTSQLVEALPNVIGGGVPGIEGTEARSAELTTVPSGTHYLDYKSRSAPHRVAFFLSAPIGLPFVRMGNFQDCLFGS